MELAAWMRLELF